MYLQGLDLSHNHLEGSLPSELSNCTELLNLDVGFNSLNGSIPSSLRSSSLDQKIEIVIFNHLSGLESLFAF